MIFSVTRLFFSLFRLVIKMQGACKFVTEHCFSLYCIFHNKFTYAYERVSFLQNTSSGIMHQIQYDDPASLTTKYTFAVDQNLRGVGVWNCECLNYTSGLSDDIVAVQEMWGALPYYYV